MLSSSSRAAGRRERWNHGALILLAMAAAGGCASTRATVKEYGGDAQLQLPDPAAWTQYEVRRHSFNKRVDFRSLDSGSQWVVKFKGNPMSWMAPVNILVPPKYYEERAHSGKFRFAHPFTHEPLLLQAHAISHTVATVPVPSSARPEIEILDGKSEETRGTLSYDLHSLSIFAGELDGHRVEIVQNAGAPRPHNPLQTLVRPFPFAGEFAVSLDGQNVARFIKHVPRGTVAAYHLALSMEATPEQRDEAALAFTIFVLMEEFINSSYT